MPASPSRWRPAAHRHRARARRSSQRALAPTPRRVKAAPLTTPRPRSCCMRRRASSWSWQLMPGLLCHGARALPLAQTHVEHHAPARTFALVVVPDACWPSGASESPGSLCWFACVSSSCGYVWVERPYRYRLYVETRAVSRSPPAARTGLHKEGRRCVIRKTRNRAALVPVDASFTPRCVCGVCVRNWCEKR